MDSRHNGALSVLFNGTEGIAPDSGSDMSVGEDNHCTHQQPQNVPSAGRGHAPSSYSGADTQVGNTCAHQSAQAGPSPESSAEESDIFAAAPAGDVTDEFPPPEGDRIILLFGAFVDGVQLSQHGRTSTTVISIRCLDMPGHLSTTDIASYPAAFIGGINCKEPTTMSELMQYFCHPFKEHEPMGELQPDGSIVVRGNPIRVYDSYRKRFRDVFPVFACAFADTPARRGWLLTTGHTSQSGCDRCGLRSVRTLPCGTPLDFNGFTGYTHPELARVFNKDTNVRPLALI